MDAAPVLPHYGFEETIGGDFVEFNVMPPPIARSEFIRGFLFQGMFSFVGLIVGLVIGFAINADWALIFPIAGVVVPWFVLGRVMKSARSALVKPSVIRVTSEGVTVNHRLYARKHVSSISIGNEQSEFIVPNEGGTGVARYSEAISSRMFMVKMRYGSDPVVLTKGVTEGTATALVERLLPAFEKYATLP